MKVVIITGEGVLLARINLAGKAIYSGKELDLTKQYSHGWEAAAA